MTHVPSWLNEVVRQFASGLGLQTFALNADGVAALHFENGVVLRLEYAFDFLTLTMSAEPPTTAEALPIPCVAVPLRCVWAFWNVPNAPSLRFAWRWKR